MASPNSFSDSYAQAGPGDVSPGVEMNGVHQAPTQAQTDQGSTSNADLVYPQGSLPFYVISRGSVRSQERRCEEVMSELRGVRATIEQLKEQKQKDLEQKEDQLKQMTFDRDANKTLLELKTKELELEKRENKQQLAEMSEELKQKDKEIKQKDEELKQKDEELKQKDAEISELKAQNKELEKLIEQLTTEKEQLKKTIRDMEAQMQELNQSVCDIQNQSVTMQHEVEQCVMKEEFSAKMHEMEERADRADQRVDEKVDKRMEEKLEDAMKLKLAELMNSLAVSNTSSPETAQLAAAAVAKLQTDKRLSPKSGSPTPSPSRSPANVPTPPAENEQVQ